MLDKEDLQAIAQLIDQRISESENRMKVLIDQEVIPRFNLLAENQSIMIEKMEKLDDMEVMDTRITALEAMVKKLNREVQQLKRAQ